MQSRLQISFRGMESSPAIEARVRELAKHIERFSDRITGCHVVVQAPHQHHRQGGIYEVKIRIRVPRGMLIVDRDGPLDHAHEDVYVALRDAFAAAGRRLEDFARVHDHRTRPHEAPTHGKVTRVFPEDGYGFIETADGLDVYFHEHSVVDGGLARLKVGDEVRLEIAEQESPDGPQASTVRPIGKHHLSS